MRVRIIINMNISVKNTLSGILWGIALGIPGAILGGFAGFSLFGLTLFADTNKAKMLIFGTAIIVFVVIFLIAFWYFRNRETDNGIFLLAFPVVLIFAEVFGGFIVLHALNNYTSQINPTPTITDTTLGAIYDESHGTYHVVAEVKENINRLVLADLPNKVLEVNQNLNATKSAGNLVVGRWYYFTIEKKVSDNNSVIYYIIDFQPYGPNN